MKLRTGILLAFAVSTAAVAQDAILSPGTYAGSYPTSQNTTVTIRLNVTSVEGESVKGSGYRSSTARGGGQCAGEYPMEGTLKGNELTIRGKATQRDGECTLSLRAVVSGNRLEAKLGANDFVMTK